jgi:hypothetical protein
MARQTAVLSRCSPTDAKGRMRQRHRTRQQRRGENSVDNRLALGYGDSTPATNVKGAAESAAFPKKDERPTHDQMYLATKICEDSKKTLSPAAIQKLNTEFGSIAVVSAMRMMRGFPPPLPVRSVYAYLRGMLKESQ